MINEQDVKIALLALLALFIFFGGLVFGLGYWVGSCDDEPAPAPAIAVPNKDID